MSVRSTLIFSPFGPDDRTFWEDFGVQKCSKSADASHVHQPLPPECSGPCSYHFFLTLLFSQPSSLRSFTMSEKTSKKRASPGADVKKSINPLEGVEIGDEDAKKLTDVQKDIQRAELILGTSFLFLYIHSDDAEVV